jgi:hypothetical protein
MNGSFLDLFFRAPSQLSARAILYRSGREWTTVRILTAIDVWSRNGSLSTSDQYWIRLGRLLTVVSTPGATQRDNNSTECWRILLYWLWFQDAYGGAYAPGRYGSSLAAPIRDLATARGFRPCSGGARQGRPALLGMCRPQRVNTGPATRRRVLQDAARASSLLRVMRPSDRLRGSLWSLFDPVVTSRSLAEIEELAREWGKFEPSGQSTTTQRTFGATSTVRSVRRQRGSELTGMGAGMPGWAGSGPSRSW